MMTRTRVMLAAVAALVCGSQAAFASGILTYDFKVDPQGNYLMDPANRSPVSPLFIDLCDLGLSPGTSIHIVAKGGLCFFGTSASSTADAPCLTGDGGTTSEWAAYLGGAFSSMGPGSHGGYLLDGVKLNRLPGAVSSGLPDVADRRTYVGDRSTEISQDFWIPTGDGLDAVIPENAQYLVVAVLDSFYGDNSDPSRTLGVAISVQTPEPSTVLLFAAGFGALAAFKRMRSEARP